MNNKMITKWWHNETNDNNIDTYIEVDNKLIIHVGIFNDMKEAYKSIMQIEHWFA